jgi:RNA 2',3'-cyclic 3'-phosphodiesterase
MTRTFIALELNESLQSHLGGMLRQMAQQLPRLRWADPAGIHLTLAFLGELSDEQLVQASEATAHAAQTVSPFTYGLSHLGTFGSPRQLRVVWVGIDEPAGKLVHLQRNLNKELVQRGFEVDTRPFSPHFTLARIKAPLNADEYARLQNLVANKQLIPSSATYDVHGISVMKSELFRAGAKYTCLQDYTLGEP